MVREKIRTSTTTTPGLFHYFQDTDGWNCLTPEEYSDRKHELGDVSFATRQPLTKAAQFGMLEQKLELAKSVIDMNAAAALP